MSKSFRCPVGCGFETDVIVELGEHLQSHAAKPVSPVRHPLSTREVNDYFDKLAAAQQSAAAQQRVDSMFDADELPEGLMTRREVAEFLAVSVRTVQRMDARETLTRVDVPGVRGARYRRADVLKLVEGG